MPRILIVYTTFDGQTRRIAQHIGAVLSGLGHAVTLRDGNSAAAAEPIGKHDAVIVGGAIRYGRHARSLERFARGHLAEIASRPGAFFSVCLSAGGPGAKPAEARRYVEEFCRRTGWEPGDVASFAGALRYRAYGPFIRFLMRLIVGAAGGDTDTSRDYEYTDWAAVERFARAFGARIAQPAAA